MRLKVCAVISAWFLKNAVLFKGTVAENLRWGDENASEQTLEEALEISQAKEFVDSKPGKLEFIDRTKPGEICPAGRDSV